MTSEKVMFFCSLLHLKRKHVKFVKHVNKFHTEDLGEWIHSILFYIKTTIVRQQSWCLLFLGNIEPKASEELTPAYMFQEVLYYETKQNTCNTTDGLESLSYSELP